MHLLLLKHLHTLGYPRKHFRWNRLRHGHLTLLALPPPLLAMGVVVTGVVEEDVGVNGGLLT